MTPTHENHDLELAVKSSLIILFSLGILGMLVFCLLARNSEEHVLEVAHNEGEEECGKTPEDFNVYFLHFMQLIFLGIFAMGSVGHDLLKIVDIAQCLDTYKTDLKRLKEASLAYECIKLVFEFGQIYFLAHFRRYRCRSDFTRFILGLIFAANLCIWFYVLVSESLNTWNDKSTNTDPHHHKDITNSDASPSNSTSCENGTTKTSEMLETWQPYLYPLTMEFCLMATGLLGSMWNLKSKTVVNDEPASHQTSTVASQPATEQHSNHQGLSQAITTSEQENMDVSEDETTPFVNIDLSNNGQYGSISNSPNSTSSNKEKSRTCPAVFYLASLLSITLFFLAAANQDDLWKGYCWVYMFFHLSLLMISVFVCFMMRKSETQPAQFGPNQTLLLVSTSALLLLTLLELIPPLSNISGLNCCEKLLIATDVFLLVSVFLQTSILLKSCTLPDSKNRYLRGCFSWIAVLNLYMWFEDSIYAHKLDSTLYLKHHEFYDPMVWTVCKLILMPPCIFYRIHVAEMFGERFFKL
ncbi:hypothetical protein ACJMK2_023864 [Sinanodonta woodiana]|uniref:Uncharacterized protein n=1 Tax=Sinanodonta woodiana TaxID=1069815 RepID=A0ABD3T7A6_SINWO